MVSVIPAHLAYLLELLFGTGSLLRCDLCSCQQQSSTPRSYDLLSGWFLRLSLRYAFFISASLAPLSTPSVL